MALTVGQVTSRRWRASRSGLQARYSTLEKLWDGQQEILAGLESAMQLADEGRHLEADNRLTAVEILTLGVIANKMSIDRAYREVWRLKRGAAKPRRPPGRQDQSVSEAQS